MDVIDLLKDVKNLNEYISITQGILDKWENGKNIKVTNNIETALTLKKNRSFEIEYLMKCNENGAACIVFEHLLKSPPSKVWGVLAKCLISLLHYWLQAVRKLLIDHSNHWWRFLKLILKFIMEIRKKNPAIPNMLVEIISECLFELATTAKVDVFQQHTIIQCLNGVCDESGREVRFAMRTKFGDYFVKIAAHMAKSGYFHYQYSMLECLVRWLVPRHEPALRAAAAEKWLLREHCPPAATALFVNRSWKNFFQDARDFLNAVNEGNGLGTSVVCRQLSIGNVVIINGTERRLSWFDFNTAGKSVSVLVEARALQAFGVPNHSGYESLLIDNEITETALLARGPLGLTITLRTVCAPYIRPCGVDTGDERQVTAVISSQADLDTVDGAMRNTFGDKYQSHLVLNTVILQSPQRSYKNEKASLKDKLAALPKYTFHKKLDGVVCVQPDLSHITEVTEQDDRSTYSTAKAQLYGACSDSLKILINSTTTPIKPKREDVTVIHKGGRRLLLTVFSDYNTSLLEATDGSADDLVINETIEQLSKPKDFQSDNLVDLLVQRAFEAQSKKREVSDSGINTDDRKSQIESKVVNNPDKIKETTRRLAKNNCTVISESTTDEEFITPLFAKKINETNPETSDNFDDNLFLVNKDVNTDVKQAIFDDKAVVDCLNDMVDKVCSDLKKYTGYLFDKNAVVNTDATMIEKEQPVLKRKVVKSPILKPIKSIKLKYKSVKITKARVTKKGKHNIKKMSTITEHTEEKINPETNENVEVVEIESNKPGLKLKTPNAKAALVRKKRKLYSPKDNDIDDEIQQFTADKIDDVSLSEIKTRNINKSSKTTAICYKELEKERKEYNIRPSKIRKSKTNVIEIPSPKTLKNNTMFDNLKNNVENTECIKLVDKNSDVYNFTSDSEDQDFKKKIDIQKKINESTSSLKFTTKRRNPRRAKRTVSSNEETKKITKRKKVAKRTKQKAGAKNAVSLVKVSDVLDDERMREVVRDELDTSILIHHPINLEPKEPEPVITEVTQIEVIYDSNSNDTYNAKKAKKTQMAIHVEQSNDTTAPKKRANKRAKKTELHSIKKEKGLALKYKTPTVSGKEDEGNMSPLPELVVETMNKYREDANDSLITNESLLQKMKRIFKDGSDPDNDTVTKQNMLSDVETFNFTGQNCVNITKEVCLEDVSKENMDAKATANINEKGKKIDQLKTRSQKKIETKEYDTISIIEIEDGEVNDNQVEKSISTDGITAHGNSDEDPPIPDSINEHFQPREIQDLDQSMKDYFNKLTKEIHNSKDGGSITSVENEESRYSLPNISPVVSVKRLSFESISKYMPSQRTSDSESPPSSPKKKITKTTTKTSKTKSDLKKLSTPNTSTPDENTLHNENRRDGITSPTVSVKHLSFEDIDSDRSPSSAKNKITKIITKTRKTKSDAQMKNKSMPRTPTPDSSHQASALRNKTIISPIVSVKRLSFEDIHKWIPSFNSDSQTSPTSTISKKITPSELSERKFKSIPKPVAAKTINSPETSTYSSKSPSISKARKSLKEFNKWLSKPCFESQEEKSRRNSKRCSVMASKSPLRVSKRKLSSPIRNDAKLRRIDASKQKVDIVSDIIINSNEQSFDSVNSWLKRAGPSGYTENLDSVSVKGTLHNIMERLDTTLVEINYNTSKKFANLFVESKKQQSDQKKEIAEDINIVRVMVRNIDEKVAEYMETISDMVRHLKEKIADLDRKSQTAWNNLLERMEQQAIKLMREETKERSRMVQLLKDEVQAAIDRFERN